MEHLEAFPKLSYFGKKMTDITIRLDFINDIKDNVAIFDFVDIRDGEKPEDLAFLIYGDAGLDWLILYLNDMVRPSDWPMTDKQLRNYISQKYGAENIYEAHHYETTSSHDLGEGVWVNFGEPFSTAVSNYDYETELNEAKRKIKIVKTRYIQQITSEYLNKLR